jgi:hypothetical protein
MSRLKRCSGVLVSKATDEGRHALIQVMAQCGGSKLTQIGSPILSTIRSQGDEVTKGTEADILWPELLRGLGRLDRSYKE